MSVAGKRAKAIQSRMGHAMLPPDDGKDNGTRAGTAALEVLCLAVG